MASDLLLIVKKSLKKLNLYNLINYRVINDETSDSFNNGYVSIRIKKVDLNIIRDKGDVYFEVKSTEQGNEKFYFIEHVFKAMKKECPRALLESSQTETEIEYAFEVLIKNLENVKSFIYSSSSQIKLEEIINQKKKEFITSFEKQA